MDDLNSKCEHAEEQKRSALMHSELVEEMLLNHKKDLVKKTVEEVEQRRAIEQKLELDLQKRLAETEKEERRKLEIRAREEYDRLKREAQAKRIAEETEAKFRRQFEEEEEKQR